MSGLRIDQELCIRCGQCAQDCPTRVIEMKDIPVLEKEGCFECGHCLAVCPTGALSIAGRSPADSTPLKGNLPSAGQMATLIKGRRSVRRYRDEPIDPETLRKLLDITAHAPTGVNAQSVLLTVIDNKQVMDAFRDEVYARLAAVLPEESPENDHAMDVLIFALKDRKQNGSDVIFRGAPHLVVSSAPASAPCPEADAHIALTYFELMAPSMGIGAVWDGIFMRALARLPDLKSRLGIPEDHRIGYAMAFGKPAVEYHRTVERGPARVNTVKAFGYPANKY